jgi:hypothetical protein
MDNIYMNKTENFESFLLDIKLKHSHQKWFDYDMGQIFEMSKRLDNGLKKQKIFSLNDLCQFSLVDIISLNSIGKKSFDELIQHLNSLEDIEVDNKVQISFSKFLNNLSIHLDNNELNNLNTFENAGFSKRLFNVLMKNKLYTLRDISVLSEEKLKSLRSMGNLSFQELKKYMLKKYSHLLHVNDESPKKDFFINEIIKKVHFENHSISLKYIFNNQAINEFEKIGVIYFFDLIENLNFQKVQSVLKTQDNIQTIELLTQLEEPVINVIWDKFYEAFINISNVHLGILRKRSQGKTLQLIGDSLELTRERIRQIESKLISKIKVILNSNYFFTFLNMIAYEDYISIQKLSSLLDDDKSFIRFIFNQIHEVRLEGVFLNIESFYASQREMQMLPDYLELDELLLNYDKETPVHQEIINNWHQYCNKYSRRSLQLNERYKIVLEKHFTSIKIYENIDIEKFKILYHSEFCDDSINKKSNRSIAGVFERIQGLKSIGRGEYAFAEINLNQKIVDRIFEYIIERKYVSFDELKVKFKDELKVYNIDNRYQLHAVFKTINHDFNTNRDYIYVRGFESKNISIEIQTFIDKQKGIFTERNIKDSIPGISQIQIQSYLSKNDRIISMYNQRYIKGDQLIISEDEKNKLLDELILWTSNDRIISSNQVLNNVMIKIPELINRFNIDNTHYAMAIVKYFFKDKFQFKNNFMATLGVFIDDTDNRIINHFKDRKSFEIKEIFNYLDYIGIPNQNMKLLIEKFSNKGYVRIDNTTLMQENELNINEIVINDVESVISFAYVDIEISYDTIIDYSDFPDLNVDWSFHLIAYLLNKYSRKIAVETVANSYLNIKYYFREINL